MARLTTSGEDGTRVLVSGLYYSQIPLKGELTSHSYKLLGRLAAEAGTSSSCELDDETLGAWIGRSRQTVQRCWLELEAAGLVERRRRNGRRRIVLLYTLAGREGVTYRQAKAAKLVHACLTTGQPSEPHACPTGESTAPQGRDMHVSGVGRPSNSKEGGEKEQQKGGSAAGVVASFPTGEENPGEPTPPSRSAFLAGLVSDLGASLDAKRVLGKAAGRRDPAKDPRRPVKGSTLPDEPKCTPNPSNCQDGLSRTKHKDHS